MFHFRPKQKLLYPSKSPDRRWQLFSLLFNGQKGRPFPWKKKQGLNVNTDLNFGVVVKINVTVHRVSSLYGFELKTWQTRPLKRLILG